MSKYYKILMEFTDNTEYYEFDDIKIYKDKITKKEQIISNDNNYDLLLYNIYPMINIKMKENRDENIHWKLLNKNNRKSYDMILELSKYRSKKNKNFLQIFIELGINMEDFIDVILKNMTDYLTADFFDFLIKKYKITDKQLENTELLKENELLYAIIINYDRKIINNGIDINVINQTNFELLMKYINNKQEKESLELIPRIIDDAINKWNTYGETALLLACWSKMEKVALELIPRMTEEGINKWDIYGRTALFWACMEKMEKVALELIPRMTKEAINKWDNKGRTSLFWACQNKMEKVALELISRMTEEAKSKWNIKYDVTALHMACCNKMEKVALELIPRMTEEGINKWNINGWTALHTACYNNMEKVAMELIPRMTEEVINKWNNCGNTALIWACKNKMEEVALELIPRMTEEAINKVDKNYNRAVNYAAMNNMLGVIKMIK